mgnify:CR=1 FL=1
MYNVCTLYTTAVGVILARQLACFRYVFCSLRSHGARDKAGSIIDRCYRERVSVEVFCSLRSHGTRFAYGRLRAQALSNHVPGQGEQAFNPGFVLVMFVTEVVGGHG